MTLHGTMTPTLLILIVLAMLKINGKAFYAEQYKNEKKILYSAYFNIYCCPKHFTVIQLYNVYTKIETDWHKY